MTLTLEPMIINNNVRGHTGFYRNVKVIVFNGGLNPRYDDYSSKFTLSIIDSSDKMLWCSNWANTQFDSKNTAITFAKDYIDELFTK